MIKPAVHRGASRAHGPSMAKTSHLFSYLFINYSALPLIVLRWPLYYYLCISPLSQSCSFKLQASSFHEYLDVHQPAKSDHTLVSSVPYLCYLIRQMPATHCCLDNFAYRCVHTLVLSRVVCSSLVIASADFSVELYVLLQ